MKNHYVVDLSYDQKILLTLKIERTTDLTREELLEKSVDLMQSSGMWINISKIQITNIEETP